MEEEHPQNCLQPISWLAGRWSTKDGQGSYPTIKNFRYHETLQFVCVGQAMYNYISTSTRPDRKKVMHQERGFLCIKPGTNEVSFLVSHNIGLTSVEEGMYDPVAKEIYLKTTSVSHMSFAKQPHVKSFHRKLNLTSEGKLQMTIYMETDKIELTQHLKAVYNKQQ